MNKLQKIMLQHFTNATFRHRWVRLRQSHQNHQNHLAEWRVSLFFFPSNFFELFPFIWGGQRMVFNPWDKPRHLSAGCIECMRVLWFVRVCSICLAWMFVNATALPGQDAKASVCPPVYHAGKKRWVWQKIVILSHSIFPKGLHRMSKRSHQIW